MAPSTSTAGLLVRVVVAFALTYVLGYERELRGDHQPDHDRDTIVLPGITPPTIAPDNGTTGVIAFLFAVAQGGLE